MTSYDEGFTPNRSWQQKTRDEVRADNLVNSLPQGVRDGLQTMVGWGQLLHVIELIAPFVVMDGDDVSITLETQSVPANMDWTNPGNVIKVQTGPPLVRITQGGKCEIRIDHG